MEDQGIMALPQAGMQAPTVNPQAEASIAAFDQARTQMDPKEFGDDLLSSASEMDPAAVQEFKAALQRANLPPEVIDALGDMIDAILAEPENYQEIRAAFIAEGVPEDILPPEFDANYFGSMNLALDQLSAQGAPMTPQGFANGGMAMRPIPAGIASLGRGQDTMMAHISPAEARLLRRRGGSGTINPYTGQPEYFKKFFKSVAKAVGGVFKSVGNAVSSVVKGVTSAIKKFASSTVGRLVATVALGFFLGPAAASFLGVSSAAGVAAVSGFIGSSGSTLLAGGSIKDALKAGAIGGLTAGALAGITGGASAFESGSYTGPTTIAGQVEKFTEGLKSLTGMGTPQVAGPDFVPGPQGVSDVGYVPPEAMGPPAPMGPQPVSYPGAESFGMPTQMAAVQSPTMTDISAGTMGQASPQLNPFEQAYQNQSFNQAIGLGETSPFDPSSSPSNVAIERSALGMTGPLDTARQAASSAYDMGSDIYNRFLSPNRNMPAPTALDDRAAVLMEKYGLSGKDAFAQASSEAAKATPGMLARYGPIVAAGTGLAYAGGMFDPVMPEIPEIVPKETGFDLYEKYPEKYKVTPGGVQTTFAPPSITPGYGQTTYEGSPTGYGQMGNPFALPQFQVRDPREYLPQFGPQGIGALQPRGYAFGGLIRRVLPSIGSIREASGEGGRPRGGGFLHKAIRRLLDRQKLERLQAEQANPSLASAQSAQELLQGSSAQPQAVLSPSDFSSAQSAQELLQGSSAQPQAVLSPSDFSSAMSSAFSQPVNRNIFPGYGPSVSPFFSPPSFAVRMPEEYLPPGLAASAPRQFNLGGFAKGGGLRSLAQRYPRRTGQISGPGTEKSDSIPAMLSDGEFVMTAQAVRGAGGGSRREGAKRMYEMMRRFERKA